MTRPLISLIAAVAANGAIGKDNDLLFNDPRDQKHFRATTLGCPVIMGRRNIVVTRQAEWQAPGAEVAHSLAEALALLGDAAAVPKAFVMGGGQLYAEALPLADELELTEVNATFEADTFFPAWPREAFDEIRRESHPGTPEGGPRFDFVTYRRKSVG